MAVRIPFIAAIVMVACAEIASLLTSGCAPNIDDTVQHTKSVSIDVVCGRASDCSRATVPFGYDSYVFNADGAISAERSAFGERPPIFESRTEFRALVGRLLRTTPFVFARRARPRSYATAPASWIVTLVLDDGRYRSIDVPQPERGRRPASGDALLQSWIIDTEAGAAKRLAVARARMTARLGDVGNLASVEFDANGCFGDCPAYVVRFYPSGAATLDGADFPGSPVHVHRATVPFNRINDLLVSVSFAHLERSYPIHGVDMFGAAFALRYRDGFRYDVKAPDETSWPPQFNALFARIDQLVLDTRWTPPLAPRRSSLYAGPRLTFGTPRPRVPSVMIGTWSRGSCATLADRLVIAPDTMTLGARRPMPVRYEPHGGYGGLGPMPVLRWTQYDEYDLFSYDAARHTIVQHPDSSEALPDVDFKRCRT